MAMGDFLGRPPKERRIWASIIVYLGPIQVHQDYDGKGSDYKSLHYRLRLCPFVVNQTFCASQVMIKAGRDRVTSPLSRSFVSADVVVAVHIFRTLDSSRWTLKVSGLIGVDDISETGFISEHAACAAFLTRMANDDRLKMLNAAMIVPFDSIRLNS